MFSLLAQTPQPDLSKLLENWPLLAAIAVVFLLVNGGKLGSIDLKAILLKLLGGTPSPGPAPAPVPVPVPNPAPIPEPAPLPLPGPAPAPIPDDHPLRAALLDALKKYGPIALQLLLESLLKKQASEQAAAAQVVGESAKKIGG